ncbi:MAG: hypothetical protein ACW98Y_15210 [Candidatus Thorarchaeota archaeon]|jgi:hypothetical protein
MSKSKKSKLIRTRGMGLSIKLFKFEGLNLSPAKLTSTLKAIPYAPKKKKDITAGFAKATASGKVVVCNFVAGFRVPVQAFDAETPVHYVSVDKGTAYIKLDKGTIEIRGSERVARKCVKTIADATGAKIRPMNLNGGTKKLYDSAADIAAVLLTGVEKGALTQAEFKGTGIQTEEEIGLYTRRYKGSIARFRGTFAYPSGAFLTTVVNAETGSLMVYRSGDGILEKDANWIVELMEESAV